MCVFCFFLDSDNIGNLLLKNGKLDPWPTDAKCIAIESDLHKRWAIVGMISIRPSPAPAAFLSCSACEGVSAACRWLLVSNLLSLASSYHDAGSH